MIKKKTALIMFLLIFVLVFFNTVSADTNEKHDTYTYIIADSDMINEYPDIAIYRENIYIVWCVRNKSTGNSSIFFRKSSDNGNIWSETINLTGFKYSALYPKITITNENNIHVIWKDHRDDYPEIYYRRSMDGGLSWENEKRISYNNTIHLNKYDFNLLSYQNNIYIAWKDYVTHPAEIYFKKSTDNGETWSGDVRLTYHIRPSYDPTMKNHQNNLYLIWEDWYTNTNVCFMYSNNSGKSWTDPIYLTDTEINNYLYSDISVYNDLIHVIWQEDTNNKKITYYRKSDNHGEKWSDRQELTEEGASPKIFSYKNNVNVIWIETKDNYNNIYFKHSNNKGDTWSENSSVLYKTEKSISDIKIKNQKENIHIVAIQTDKNLDSELIYMKEYSNKPIITSFDFSKKPFDNYEKIELTVYGFDEKFDNSVINCTIQYRHSSADWQEINTTFIDDHWESTFKIPTKSKTTEYQFKSMLINPDGNESEWSYLDIITIEQEKNQDETPGFEMFYIILSIVIAIFILRRKKHE